MYTKALHNKNISYMCVCTTDIHLKATLGQAQKDVEANKSDVLILYTPYRYRWVDNYKIYKKALICLLLQAEYFSFSFWYMV